MPFILERFEPEEMHLGQWLRGSAEWGEWNKGEEMPTDIFRSDGVNNPDGYAEGRTLDIM